MRIVSARQALAIGICSFMLVGCAATMGKSQAAYDPSRGTQTVAFHDGIYQTRGVALPLRDDQLVKVGTAEGLELYQLKGGGGGPAVEVLYVKTTDGRYQPLTRIQ